MQRYFLADLRTGRQILDLQPLDGSWACGLNDPEDIDVTLNMNDPDTIALGLRNTSAPAKTVLAVAEGDVILGAGPIWTRTYDRNAKTLKLGAKGVWSYYDHRHILPVLAKTLPTTQFIVPDPADPTKTIPNPLLNTNLSNLWLGTIAKRLVQQAHAWTGGALPIVFENDEVGVHLRNWTGVEFKNLGEALAQLTEVEGGPDIRFEPRFTGDMLGIEWVLRTGTAAKPLLASETIHLWDLTVPESAASNLTVTEDASNLASLGWQTGGRSDDTVMIARAEDTSLVDFGFPLFETLDSSHSSVSQQSTLDAYAAESVLYGRGPSEVWAFNAEANQKPLVGSYQAGDYCDLAVAPYDPVTCEGDPFIPGGRTPYRQRIIHISGALGDETVKIQCAPSRAF